jgi:hypothetical protein
LFGNQDEVKIGYCDRSYPFDELKTNERDEKWNTYVLVTLA